MKSCSETTSIALKLCCNGVGRLTCQAWRTSACPKKLFSLESYIRANMTDEPQKMCFKDQLKRQLSAAGIPEKDWESIATDRHSCWASTKQGMETCEAGSAVAGEVKHRWWKEVVAQNPPAQGFPCQTCTRVCLHNHQRTHHQRLPSH